MGLLDKILELFNPAKNAYAITEDGELIEVKKGMVNAKVPDGVTKIKGGGGETPAAFHACRETLTSVILPNGVTYIGAHAFHLCTKLTKIEIPDSVTHIGRGTFSECKNLAEITIPKGVTYIDKFVFQRCENLKEVTIPDGVTYIDDYAFSSCDALTNMIIPDGVTYIGAGAFAFCGNLKEITIPKSVSYMGADAFSCYRSYPLTIHYKGTEEEWKAINRITIGQEKIGAIYKEFSGKYISRHYSKWFVMECPQWEQAFGGLEYPPEVVLVERDEYPDSKTMKAIIAEILDRENKRTEKEYRMQGAMRYIVNLDVEDGKCTINFNCK